MHSVTRSVFAAFATALLTLPIPLLAQPQDKLEEITVTAAYRPTELAAAVGSVTVITEDAIQARAAQHLQDILNIAPNVTWAGGASRSRFIQIRGVGDLEQFYDPKYYPSVGMQLDDLELGNNASAGMLFDIAQVEVLRGPQGTRYGASGHAGLVNIRSNAPTDEFEGELSAGAGNYDSYDLGLVLSGPLNTSTRGRLAVQQNNSDGYIDNDQVGANDTNNFDELSARGRLQWEPTDSALYDFSLLYFDADNGYDTWSLENNRNTQSDQPGEDTQDTVAATASGQWQLNAQHSLQARLNYTDSDLRQNYDSDWVADDFCVTYLCSYGNDTASEAFDRSRELLVADIRLLGGNSSLAAGEGRYVVGLYANDGSESLDYDNRSLWYGTFGTDSDYDTRRYAVYGEYEHALTGQLTLVGGLRLERFEDDYEDSNAFAADNSDDLWNWELSARYALNDTTTAYATLARSSKPGGVNTTASANQPFMSPIFQAFTDDKLAFGDEQLLNKEIGIRTEQFDQRLALSLALFHTDRDNAQLEAWMWDEGAGLWISYLDSTSDATSYGVEFESTLAVTEQVALFLSAGWLETEVDDIEVYDLDTAQFVHREDRDQARSPNYQYNLGTRVAFSDQWSGLLELEGRDDSYFGYYHNGKLGSYDLLNASLTWQHSKLRLTLWGRNLADEDYAVHGLYFSADPRDDFGAWQNLTYLQPGAPRTYGIEMRYAF